ncbi:MAG: cell division protein SepF [Candidatus Aenigmatarchaeota archaeon]
MPLKKVLEEIKSKKAEESGEEYVEIPESILSGEQKLNVRIENLRDFLDTDRIQQLLREGNIIFLKIKDLRNRDITELKRSVDKLRKTCLASGGDIVGVEEDFLILTPNFAKIYRG